MNKKTLLTSLMSIAMLMSVGAGATYALFTSDTEVNIAVTSGTVSYKATIEGLDLYSPAAISLDGKVVDGTDVATETTFVNGGTAKLEEGNLTLSNMTPGDKVTFKINVVNNSTVLTKHQTVIAPSNDTGLFAGLNVKINGEVYDGSTIRSDWIDTEVGEDPTDYTVDIELPANATNEYQGKSVNLNVSLSAVQANAVTHNPSQDPNVLDIYNLADLKEFAANVNNGDNYAGKTVRLMSNIDLKNEEWTPIGEVKYTASGNWDWNNSTHFAGSFDGQGYTISNLYIDEIESNIRGFFGYGKMKEVKNVNFNNVNVKGKKRSAILVGQNDGGLSISNVNFTGDIKVEISSNEVGAVIGRGTINSISNVTIAANEGSYVKCSVTNNNYNEYVGSVWGHAWPTYATNISSNIDVYAYAAATGGIGGGCALNSDNISCTGNVTLAISDSEIHAGTLKCWQTNGTIYGFGVGSTNSATHTNCSSTGTLTIAGNQISDLGITNTGYNSNDVRFGAPYYANGVITIVD